MVMLVNTFIYNDASAYELRHIQSINQSIFVYLMTRHHNWHKRNCTKYCRTTYWSKYG